MSDEIQDLDDVEAIAWFHAWCIARERENAACDRSAEVADECVRLLRERRSKVPSDQRELSKYLGARLEEREQIVAWLRQMSDTAWLTGECADAIERGEHDR